MPSRPGLLAFPLGSPELCGPRPPLAPWLTIRRAWTAASWIGDAARIKEWILSSWSSLERRGNTKRRESSLEQNYSTA